MLNALLFTGTITSDVFYGWLMGDLLPKWPALIVIVMDNAGHLLLFMTKYSPDLNSIEQKWAQEKKFVKKYNCSIDEIVKPKLNHFI
jgi:transposase